MAKQKIKILFLSAEAAPLAKIGGLADVAGSLPPALAKLKMDIILCLPFYGLIDFKKYPAKKIINKLIIPVGSRKESASVWKIMLPKTKVPVYLIKYKLFNNKTIYSNNSTNDVKRFSFYTRASLEIAKTIAFQPDIIHANDWHTGLTAAFIKTLNKHDNFFKKTKVLYTIHNLASQGITKPQIISYTRIDPHLPIVKVDAKNGDINLMVQGILGSDLINTVSPTYAKEILRHYQGAGLDKILKKRKNNLSGIINGIDTNFFNPATDNLIRRKYSHKTLKYKIANKLSLQKQLGLPIRPNIALVGLVSRLAWQKGLDLINEKLSRLNCQFVFLGAGQKEYERELLKLAKKFPQQFSAQIKFEEKLAHQIYAGADIFLMPSRFEPCGLGQLIAQRYGTIPLVRSTGGLADTVDRKTGFSFKDYSASGLQKTLAEALKIFYSRPNIWRQMQLNGMKKDLSWHEPAKKYLRLYQKLLVKH